MGTRNLICVVKGGEYKVAQYSQWDGYLDGQGKTILEFLKAMDKPKFLKALDEVRWLSEAEVRATWVEAGDKPDNTSGLVSMDIGDKHTAMFPGLSRDTGAQILRLIQDGKVERQVRVKDGWEHKTFTVKPVRGLVNSITFADDDVFCEWAYVLDMDKEVLEIYTGGGKSKRFPKMTLFAKMTFAEFVKPGTFEKLKEKNEDEDA
jgi:hypothetical protein